MNLGLIEQPKKDLCRPTPCIISSIQDTTSTLQAYRQATPTAHMLSWKSRSATCHTAGFGRPCFRQRPRAPVPRIRVTSKTAGNLHGREPSNLTARTSRLHRTAAPSDEPTAAHHASRPAQGGLRPFQMMARRVRPHVVGRRAIAYRRC